MKIGLVLGAGGAVGVAYHGGVLAAIEEVTGWDPRTAEVIIGTSAGSITAAMLRAGVSSGDLARFSEDQPLSVEGSRLTAIGRPHRPRMAPTDLLRFRALADPGAIMHALAHPLSHSRGGLLAAVLPAGGISTAAISKGINAVYGGVWPADPLWLCAVELRSGRRVVFGAPGAPRAEVGSAVAASSAVPSYFAPVVIGGRRYVDGGIRSMMNLDLLGPGGPDVGLDLDLVVVSSPMTFSMPVLTPAAATLMRQLMRSRLRGEVMALRRSGLRVVTIEPGRRAVGAMGLNPMDARRRGPVSRATRASVAEWLSWGVEGRRLARRLTEAAGSTSSPSAAPASASASGLRPPA